MCQNWLGFNHVDYKHPEDCQCQYEVWAPGTADTPWVNDAFNLFAMETEQMERMNQVIDYLSRCPNPNDDYAQNKALQLAGLCFENLTSSEVKYIEEKVAQKWLEHQL